MLWESTPDVGRTGRGTSTRSRSSGDAHRKDKAQTGGELAAEVSRRSTTDLANTVAHPHRRAQ